MDMDDFRATGTAPDPHMISQFSHQKTNPTTLQVQGAREATKSTRLTEWTNEKHSLYLKSMEASFVNQLYSGSMDLPACRSQRPAEDLSHAKSSRPIHVHSHSPTASSGKYQFKVLRRGCWHNISFGSTESIKKKSTEGSSTGCDGLLASPWIRHYRSLNCKPRDAGSGSAVPGGDASISGPTPIHSEADSAILHGGTDALEVSDQNFDDEHIEGEKSTSGTCKAKRRKTRAVAYASSNDQVVPRRKLPATEDDSNNSCIPAAR